MINAPYLNVYHRRFVENNMCCYRVDLKMVLHIGTHTQYSSKTFTRTSKNAKVRATANELVETSMQSKIAENPELDNPLLKHKC